LKNTNAVLPDLWMETTQEKAVLHLC
jgi:hypothetical protein